MNTHQIKLKNMIDACNARVSKIYIPSCSSSDTRFQYKTDCITHYFKDFTNLNGEEVNRAFVRTLWQCGYVAIERIYEFCDLLTEKLAQESIDKYVYFDEEKIEIDSTFLSAFLSSQSSQQKELQS